MYNVVSTLEQTRPSSRDGFYFSYRSQVAIDLISFTEVPPSSLPIRGYVRYRVELARECQREEREREPGVSAESRLIGSEKSLNLKFMRQSLCICRRSHQSEFANSRWIPIPTYVRTCPPSTRPTPTVYHPYKTDNPFPSVSTSARRMLRESTHE